MLPNPLGVDEWDVDTGTRMEIGNLRSDGEQPIPAYLPQPATFNEKGRPKVTLLREKGWVAPPDGRRCPTPYIQDRPRAAIHVTHRRRRGRLLHSA